MARTVGDGSEVKELSRRLQTCLEEIIQLNGKGKALLGQLSQTSKDKSFDSAEGVVNEVASIVLAGLPDCSETAGKLNAYGDFLISMENG